MKTTTRRIWLAASLSALALASLSASAAEPTPGSSPEKTFTGTIAAVDLTAHTVTARGSIMFSKKFNLGSACTYHFWDNRAATENGLRPGQKIIVSYQNADGVLVADKIDQQPMRFAGWVKAVDPKAQTVTIQPDGLGFGKQFQLAQDCPVTLHGDRSGTLADIQAGNYVTLVYEAPPGLPTVQSISQTSEQFTGSLTAIDLDEKTLKAQGAFAARNFNVGDHCVIVVPGKSDGHLKDLRPDDKLVFSYNEINGVNVVNRIAPAKSTSESVSSTSPVVGY